MDAHIETHVYSCEATDYMLRVLSHIEHVSCGPRPLALERPDQSSRCDLVESNLFVDSLKCQRSFVLNSYNNGIIHMRSIGRNLSTWYGRHGFCSASRTPNSTGPNDAICTVPFGQWPIPTPWISIPPGSRGNRHGSAERSSASSTKALGRERYAAGSTVTGHEADVEISMNQDCRLCLQPGRTVSLRWKTNMNNIDVTINR